MKISTPCELIRVWISGLVVVFHLIDAPVSLAQKDWSSRNFTVCDYFNRREDVPFFKFERQELDSFLVNNRRVILNASDDPDYHGLLSFYVDRSGKLNKVEVLHAEFVENSRYELADNAHNQKIKEWYYNESVRLVKLTEGLWASDSLREKKPVFLKFVFLRNTKDGKLGDESSVFFPGQLIGTEYGQQKLYEVGIRKFSVRKTILARAYFTAATEYNPKDVSAFFNLGVCNQRLNNNKAACLAWQKCVELGDIQALELQKKYCTE